MIIGPGVAVVCKLERDDRCNFAPRLRTVHDRSPFRLFLERQDGERIEKDPTRSGSKTL